MLPVLRINEHWCQHSVDREVCWDTCGFFSFFGSMLGESEAMKARFSRPELYSVVRDDAIVEIWKDNC